MHIHSALISSFILAFAVLEQPKLQVVAQRDGTIGEWAGIQKLIPQDGYIAITAKFEVPDAPGSPGNVAFVGITLGSTSTLGTRYCDNPSASIGILIDVPGVHDPERVYFPGRVDYLPVHQWYPEILQKAVRPIGPGDVILTEITAMDRGPVVGTISNLSPDRQWVLHTIFPSLPDAWGSCDWVAEWKLGSIIALPDRGQVPLPIFNEIRFYDGYILGAHATDLIPPEDDGVTAEVGIWDPQTGNRLLVETVIEDRNQHDQFLVRQLLENR